MWHARSPERWRLLRRERLCLGCLSTHGYSLATTSPSGRRRCDCCFHPLLLKIIIGSRHVPILDQFRFEILGLVMIYSAKVCIVLYTVFTNSVSPMLLLSLFSIVHTYFLPNRETKNRKCFDENCRQATEYREQAR